MTCPHCGRDLDPTEGQRYCSFCGHELEKHAAYDSAEVAPQIDLSADQDRYCPWEDQDKIGFLEGLLRTLKESLFTPREFFYKLPVEGGIFNPATICLDNRDIRHACKLRVGFFFGSFLVGNNKVARLLDHNARAFWFQY